jgi:NAD(P)-dependent dehydrogenase (short-subunit alcohol dehydrogenase family)
MELKDKIILVTGANRGIGRALVSEALARGAKRVYAGTRVPFDFGDKRVHRLNLDVTKPEQVTRAAKEVEVLDVLINNAGVAVYEGLSGMKSITHHMAVNVFGTFGVTQAFLPHLRRSRGAIVNHVSVAALAALPNLPAYSMSKAALLNMTQSLRALLAAEGISVHAAVIGPVDTDMNRNLPIDKAPPQVTAARILDGLELGDEEIFPDPVSASIREGWGSGVAKALEQQFKTFVPPSATATAR